EKGFPRYYLSVENGLDRRLSSFARVSLYRIASEVINNVIRHAECTEYEIQFRVNDDCLIFSVEDNGLGLPEDLLIPTNTRGVFNITERAKSIGATVSWKPSRFSTGTRFELVMKLDS
ncbi:MAG: ATP-binding protein, partial [Gammaproteobacteria bacterium]|nr:ATP-binding protein [Gammaproteobacteria bacterium]